MIDEIEPDRERTPVSQIVAETLVDFPGISNAEIIGNRQNAAILKARKACIVAVYHRRPDLSVTQIGRLFNRHHTTILNAVEATSRAKNRASQQEAA